MNALNLTGYKATKEQLREGLVEVDYQTRKQIKELTQVKLVESGKIIENFNKIQELLKNATDGFDEVAISPQPYLTTSIHTMLKKMGKTVVYPIVEFEQEIYTNESGKKIRIKKTKHLGFVTY